MKQNELKFFSAGIFLTFQRRGGKIYKILKMGGNFLQMGGN